MSVVDSTQTPGSFSADLAPAPGGPRRNRSLLDRGILAHAALDAVRKLDPRVQIKSPVMFVVLIGTVVTLVESVARGCSPTRSRWPWSALSSASRSFRPG